MKKLKIKLLVFILVFGVFMSLLAPLDTFAAKKSKGITPDELTQITTTINSLMKKIYASSLFSPKDNEQLIDIKLKLDTALETGGKDPSLPQLFYNAGFIYKEREFRDDAIECFKIILDNFPESLYSVKSINELKKMGVKIETPTNQGG
ncbi:MAG: hypothetical protein V2B14_02405 [bacterium]